MSVSLSEVMAAARTHVAPLAGESAGYLVLAVADQMMGAPRAASPQGIRLAEDGTVRIVDGSAITAEAAEAILRDLLDALLLSASSATSALLRAARRAPGAGLETLVREIEAALIPVNRSAARRALSRLGRETLRAKERGALELLAPEPAPAPPARAKAAPAVTRAEPPEPEQELDVDVEVVMDDDDPAEAEDPATQAIALPVLPEPPDETEAEPQTRPEPAVLRASLRPPGAPLEVHPLRTPRIGSFLTDPAPVVAPSPAPGEAAAADCTDPMPEMLEESPLMAESSLERLPTQKSDVNVLLANFAVTEQRPDVDIRRTLKEIAGVDLTPGNVPAETR